MENSQELENKYRVGQQLIDDMAEELDLFYRGRVIEHWSDASKGFLLHKRRAEGIPNYGEIFRQYGGIGPNGETYSQDNLIFLLDDINLNKISEVQITRLGEASTKQSVRSFERLGIPLEHVSNPWNKINFTTAQIDRELAIQYTGKGDLLSIWFEVAPEGVRNMRDNERLNIDTQEIEDIRNNTDEERNFPFIQKIGDVHAVGKESGLEITVLSDKGKDIIKIPWYINREQIVSDLGVDELVKDPLTRDTKVDNRWRMNSLKRVLGLVWNQQREFEGMYEDRD